MFDLYSKDWTVSLDKAIEHGNERRKKYRRSKAFDASCRNHGDCAVCQENRMYANKKREMEAEERMKQ